MAGVNWLKLTMPRACSMQVHNGQQERVERNHSNTDIDKNKSDQNFFVGCNDWSDAYQSMHSRVEAVDKIYPPRKKLKANDRIVCASLVTYCPQAVYDSGRVREFFEKVDEVQRSFFGSDNVHGTAVHLDEIHNYIDQDNQERSSLAHGHTLVSAYVEWVDKKSGEKRKEINGKNFETRERMQALNKAIDEMCRREFGVSYMTGKGKGKGSGKSTEEVKAETQLRMVRKANDDFVRSLEPTPTKKTKNFIGKEKEIPKTEEELQRDREVLAAQAILKREDEVVKKEKQLEQEREEMQADREEMAKNAMQQEAKFREEKAAMREDFKHQLSDQAEGFTEQITQLQTENNSLKEKIQQFQQQAKSMAIAVAIRARTMLEKSLKAMGLQLPQGYTTEEQVRNAEHSLTLEQDEKGR